MCQLNFDGDYAGFGPLEMSSNHPNPFFQTQHDKFIGEERRNSRISIAFLKNKKSMKPTRLNRFSVLTSSASSLLSAGQPCQGRLRRLASIPSLVLFLAGAQSAHAADFFWDPTSSGTNAGSGSGTWNSANTNWFNGTADVIWATGNRPVFGGADGLFVVTVADNFSTTGLLFNKSGYKLSAASAQTITTLGNTSLASGVAATIGSNVTVTRAAIDLITTPSGAGGTLNIGSAINSPRVRNLSTRNLVRPALAPSRSLMEPLLT